MRPPTYLRPLHLPEALQLLAEWGARARLLAGGTDLLVRLRQGVPLPEAIIDISALDELRGVQRQGDVVTIGALTTHAEIEASPELAAWAPVLVEACREVGSVQIRNRGTLGGNLANASPAGDTLPALYVLDAEVHLLCREGERWLPVAEFFSGPGQTVRQPDELLAGVRFRPFLEGEKGAYRKIGVRRAVRIAKASVAVALVVRGGVVQRCRLALGAVAPTVIRAPQVEAYLAGRPLTDDVMREAGSLAAQACRPISDIRSTDAYRRHVVAVLVARALRAVMEQGGD